MNHTIVVFVPINSRIPTHFPEYHVDIFDFVTTRTLKHAICYAAPRIISRELYFDAKLAKRDVREKVWMGMKVNLQTKGSHRLFQKFAHATLKSTRLFKARAPNTLGGKPMAKDI